jgi:hypothetical protein
MFVSGLVLWSAAVLVTMATGNANLIPTSSCWAASWSRSPS